MHIETVVHARMSEQISLIPVTATTIQIYVDRRGKIKNVHPRFCTCCQCGTGNVEYLHLAREVVSQNGSVISS